MVPGIRLGVGLLVFGLSPFATAQHTPDKTLMKAAPSTRAIVSTIPGVVRSQPVILDRSALDDLTAGISIELFDGERVTALFNAPEPASPGHQSFSGYLAGQRNSWVSLIASPTVLVGNVTTATGHYQLRMSPQGPVLHEVDLSSQPGCGIGPEHSIDLPEDHGHGGEFSAADDGSTFDVMVAFTPDAQRAAGGKETMNALIDLAILETNQCYANSNINSQVRLVWKSKVGYDESITDFGGKLSDLQSTNDGQLDELHDIRDEVGADFIALLVDDGQYCGIAYLMTSLSNGFAAWAMSVTNWGCATGGLTFAHELGHNQGCAHDHDNANNGLYNYSFGHRFYGNSGTQYRTVMSYSPGSRIQHLSNPNVNYDGQPTGIPNGQPRPADNARGINNAALTIANWRSETIATEGLLFSTRANRTINGLSFNDEDVVHLDLDTGNLSMHLDLSDVVSAGADLNALYEMGDGSYLMSFRANLNIPGLIGGPNGDLVEPQDLVQFVPTSMGSNTAGSFTFYFDGSDVSLDTVQENIDAVSMDSGGNLQLSFRNKYFLPGLSGKDEDIVEFQATSLGATTSGTYSLVLFGNASDAKLGSTGENVDGHHHDTSSGTLVVTTKGDFRIPSNRVGQDDDLITFVPTALGAGTAGVWANTLNGADWGLDPADLDAIHILQ